LLCVLLAVAGRGLARLLPHLPLAPLTLALAFVVGPVLRRWRVPGAETPPHEVPLSVGMILLGVQLAPGTLACLGAWAPARLLLHWAVVTLLFRLAARPAGLPERTTALVGVGLTGCGLSAVIAAARGDPRTRPEERALAVATTLACGALAFVTLPLVAERMGLDDCALAAWAGMALPTTAEAVLIGAARSPGALQSIGAWRLLVNLLQGLPIVLWLRRHGPPVATQSRWESALETVRRVPIFVWGLAVLGVFGFVGAFSPRERAALSALTSWSFLTALAGVGLRLRVADLLRLGWRPVLVCVGTWALAAGLALTLA
jgi:uncharacterized membrane protein YadS